MPIKPALRSAIVLLALASHANAGENLVPDPSFEQPKPKDRWGHVFNTWSGWIYEGECEFRASDVARTGKHSLLIVGGTAPKIRAWPDKMVLEPGRYRISAYIRGLDISKGLYGDSTEFMFDGKYIPLRKSGTFGWSLLTYVGDITEKKEGPHPSFGLMSPGYFWVDDVRVEAVGKDVALTLNPIIGREEAPIVPPSEPGADAVRCPECGYRNQSAWGKCYACGTRLEAKASIKVAGPPVRPLTSFEDRNPFGGGTVVGEHATDGKKALRIDQGYVALDGDQNWLGYEALKADVYTDAKAPIELTIEIRDRQTTDYWTRVNYTTVVPPGASTLVLPTALYVGEKSRPGRPLQQDAITRVVFSLGEKPSAPLFVDNIRLERDTEPARMQFDGLWAFDVGPAGSPLMEGFQPLDASKAYSKGRGFGWKDAQIWRAFDALQPDPLYRDFVCVEKGGLAIDVPNGKYHVFVNMDSPSGYWGEFQRYRRRALILEGTQYIDTMDLDSFKKRYYRFWESDDLPSDDTFDKYQVPYFQEKHLVVDVRDQQLNIDFEGENWACSVSAIVVYPDSKAAEGQRFLDFVKARRRSHFNNEFKRVLPPATGQAVQAKAADQARGFIAFQRDWMKDVHVQDRPLPDERVEALTASGFAGEYEPVTVSVAPLKNLGRVSVSATTLTGPGGASIPGSAVDLGYVQHRITRVTMEGTVYTVSPRLIMPRGTAPVPQGVTRTFWLTVKVPSKTPPGQYRGSVSLKAEGGGELSLPLQFTVRPGTLDVIDVPAGPFGHTIDLPWYGDESQKWNRAVAAKSLAKLHEYGFTTATGLPNVRFNGFKDGKPQLDFTQGDEQMKLFREQGFRMPVVSYCAFEGLNTYYRDDSAAQGAGFTDYSAFLKAVFSAVQKHADATGWLPVYWNIGDEPIGDDLVRSAENAEAFRRAFPQGPPYFTAPSSFTGTGTKDPHFRLAKALHAVAWNLHDKAGVDLLHAAGSDWGFYNGGDRWTYGVYMYKAAKQYGMKFRIAWHWNVVAGDPYYALDCREDDYAWCNTSPDGELLPSLQFERLREGLDDYRRMLTLARLIRERPGTPAARAGEQRLNEILGGFALGDRATRSAETYTQLRAQLDAAIASLNGR